MAVSPEALLISSIIRDGDFETALKAGTTPDLFHTFREEYEFIERYYQKHKKTPSKVAFRQKFSDFRLKTANDTAHFSEEVRLFHARRELGGYIKDATQHLTGGDITEALAIVQKGFIHVGSSLGTEFDGDIIRDHDDIMDDIAERHSRYQETGSAGVPTGFITLDELTGGPQPGELWVWGARLGEGKSWTLQRMAANAIMNGYSVQFDALEQSRSQVSMRIYSMLSGQMGQQLFNARSLMQGKDYDPKEFKAFVKGLKETISGKLFLSDARRGKVSPATVATQIERNAPDIVFIDYLTLMKKNGMEWQAVAELTSELLAVSNEYMVPVSVAAQLNREHGITKKGDPPGPEALAQADAIGQDASVIINMSQWTKRVMVSKCVKSRNTEDNFKWYSHFDPSRGIYEEVSWKKAEKLKSQDDDHADAETIAESKKLRS